MCVTDRHDMTLAVNVALNLNTTNRPTRCLFTASAILALNAWTMDGLLRQKRFPSIRGKNEPCSDKRGLNASPLLILSLAAWHYSTVDLQNQLQQNVSTQISLRGLRRLIWVDTFCRVCLWPTYIVFQDMLVGWLVVLEFNATLTA